MAPRSPSKLTPLSAPTNPSNTGSSRSAGTPRGGPRRSLDGKRRRSSNNSSSLPQASPPKFRLLGPLGPLQFPLPGRGFLPESRGSHLRRQEGWRPQESSGAQPPSIEPFEPQTPVSPPRLWLQKSLGRYSPTPDEYRKSPRRFSSATIGSPKEPCSLNRYAIPQEWSADLAPP